MTSPDPAAAAPRGDPAGPSEGPSAEDLAPMRPRYGHASLADVVPAVSAAIGVPGAADSLGLSRGPLDGVRRAVVLLVDGLGYRLLPLTTSVAPTLADLATGRLGAAREVTAAFPSTTPTSLVSIATGAPPGQHGVLGFTVNIPGTRKVLTHIVWGHKPDPLSWQPLPPQFAAAAADGVAVSAVSRPEFAGTGLTAAMLRDTPYRGAATEAEIVAEVAAGLAAGPRSLVYAYTPDVDRAGHLHGVGSAEWLAAVRDLDSLLARLLDQLPDDAALLVTSDHGMLNVPLEERIDVDARANSSLRAGVRVMAGEPRVRYLHTRRGARDDVADAWRDLLGDRAWVACREEVIAQGWFGPVPEPHLPRIGDVVVVCQGRLALTASRREPPITSRLVAYHGSWTAVEMAAPLLIGRGDRLRG
ncbi:MAG: alkaline phosphatase family protein [Micromonosporaceae bacterium]